jgi:hypothetical protein
LLEKFVKQAKEFEEFVKAVHKALKDQTLMKRTSRSNIRQVVVYEDVGAF